MAEDFIGRASLLSRRVNARTTHQRVLQRYLAGAFDVCNIMMLHPRDKKYTKTCDVVKVEIRFNLFPHPIIPSES